MTRPPSRDQETHDMTTIAQRRSTAAAPFVGLALAASRADDDAAQAAERAKWLQYGQDWERRYREMYPIVDAG
jgi:hypothetical protein